MFSVSEVPRGALVGVWCGAQGVPSYVASAVRFEVGLNEAPVSRAYRFYGASGKLPNTKRRVPCAGGLRSDRKDIDAG